MSVAELQNRLLGVSAELEETRREHARARARIADLESADDSLRARLQAVFGPLSDDELLRLIGGLVPPERER